MNNMILPRNTQALIMKEREKMLNGVVGLIGRLSEEVTGSILGIDADEDIIEVTSTEKMAYKAQPVIDAEPTPKPTSNKDNILAAVESVLDSRLKSLLHDVDYRISVLYDIMERSEGRGTFRAGRVGSRDMNLASHMLDGFAFTNNSPSAGFVAWVGCHIVYKGTDNVITDGNTNKKYISWAVATPTVFVASDTKPVLGLDDVLVGINDGGTFSNMLVAGKLPHGAAVIDGTVSSSELGAGAVTSAKLAALAVLSTNLADNAVTSAKIVDSGITSGKIATGAVGSTNLAANSVIAGKIATGGISAAGQFASGVVDTSALGTGAVNDTKLAANAVTAGKIAAGGISASTQFATGVVTSTALGAAAVTAGKIAAGGVSAATQFAAGVVDTTAIGAAAVNDTKLAANAVTSVKIADNAVSTNKIAADAITTAKIGDNQITGSKIGAGTIGENKMNIATHMMY